MKYSFVDFLFSNQFFAYFYSPTYSPNYQLLPKINSWVIELGSDSGYVGIKFQSALSSRNPRGWINWYQGSVDLQQCSYNYDDDGKQLMITQPHPSYPTYDARYGDQTQSRSQEQISIVIISTLSQVSGCKLSWVVSPTLVTLCCLSS